MNKRQFLSVVIYLTAAICVIALEPLRAKSTNTDVHPSEAFQTSAFATSPTKRALLIGIDNYEHSDRIPPLAGAINDVEDLRQILIGKFDFPPDNILVLKDSEATHAQIMTAIQRHLIDKTQPGDVVVFHFSGHGSQMRDKTGKRISGLDETIVPYDSRDPEGRVFDISGAELHVALIQLSRKTRNVTFILDSCHSGTLVRGARVRSIPADTRAVEPPITNPMRDVVPTLDEETYPEVAYISAASSRESAFEYYADGKDHGTLTYFFVRALRTVGPATTYRDLMDSVIGNVTANYPSQHPSLEGAEADQYVFGDGGSLAAAYVQVALSLLDSTRVTLAIGQVEGATVGSIFDIYPPGTKKFTAPVRPTARVQLVSVGQLTSEATILSQGKIAPASRAVERMHRYGSARTRVYLDGVDQSPFLQGIRETLATVKYIEIVNQPAHCNLQLRQVGQTIQTLGADSTTLSPPVPISDPSANAHLINQLRMWAKWFNVLSIRNLNTTIDISFDIKGSETRDVMARVGKPDMGLYQGESVITTLANKSTMDLYVAILDLTSDGSIAVVYPSMVGAKEVLKPDHQLSRTLTAFVPNGRSTVTDIVKVFVSSNPIDLSPLTQGSIRKVEEAGELDPLEQLLMDSTGVTRDLVPLLSEPIDLNAWETVQRVVKVRRRSRSQ